LRILLLAVGSKMPAWVTTAFHEYAKRMPGHCTLELQEIGAQKRGKNVDIKRVLEREAKDISRAIPQGSLVISLEREGRSLSTRELSRHMQDWIDQNRDVTLLVGGPEGLPGDILAASDVAWSLSPLTYAHPLVRVIVAEQVYRAWSICAGMPYHRGE
jgi:23S rRNA (pseudouridine1915-N3)-methyltransferase